MKFSVGLFDQLFGKKTTIELTGENGKIVKRVVTEKWLDSLLKENKAKILDNVVRVHRLNPLAHDGYEVVYWTIGQDIDQETVDKFRDPNTNDLYALTVYNDGESETMAITKELFDKGIAELKNIGAY